MNRKIRLLIVEDEIAIRSGLVDVFVYHGYDVDYADDGRVGLEKALSGVYDLIVLDVMLPGMNGFEICDRIRTQDREQPIIMLTAKSSDEDIIQGLQLGADDYVAKPFSVAQLVLRVQAVLRRSRVAAAMDNHIRLGEELQIDTRNLSGYRGNDTLSFTRREMEILQYLSANARTRTKGSEPIKYLATKYIAKLMGNTNENDAKYWRPNFIDGKASCY